MADKKMNISIGGEAIALPAWATEEALEKVLKNIQAANLVDKNMLQALKSANKDYKDTYDKVKDVIDEAVQTRRQNNRGAADVKKTSEAVKEDFGKMLGSKDAKQGIANLTSILWDRGLKPGIGKIGGIGEKMKEGAEKGSAGWASLGTAASMAEKGLFGYGGYLMAIMPEFTKATKTMIDHGIITKEMTEFVGQTQDDIAEAGVSFSEGAKIAAEYAPVLAAIGGNTASGMELMLPVLDNFKNSMHELGDLGKSTPDLYSGFMEYLETLRISGQLEGGIAGREKELMQSYAELEMEQVGLAALTGKKRSEMMAAINQERMRPDAAASRNLLERNGNEAAKEAFDKIQEQLISAVELTGETSGPIKTMMDAIYSSINKANGDMDQAQEFMNTVFADMNGPMADIMRGVSQTIMSDIADGKDINQFYILDTMKKFQEEISGKVLASGGDKGEYAQALDQAKIMMQRFDVASKALQKLKDGDMTQEEFDEFMRLSIKQAGAATVAANATEELMRKIQNSVTPNMQSLAEWFNIAATAIRDFADWFDFNLFGGSADDNIQENAEAAAASGFKPEVVLLKGGNTIELGTGVTDERLKGLSITEQIKKLKEEEEIDDKTAIKLLAQYKEAVQHELNTMPTLASGGPVGAGQTVLMNEKGSENFISGDKRYTVNGGKPTLFTPDKSGTVLNKAQSESQNGDIYNSDMYKNAQKINDYFKPDMFGLTKADKEKMFADRLVKQLQELEAELYRGWGAQPETLRAARDNPMEMLDMPYFQKQGEEEQETLIDIAAMWMERKLKDGTKKMNEAILTQNMSEHNNDFHSLDRLNALKEMQSQALQTKEAALQSIRELEQTMRNIAAKNRQQNRAQYNS